MGLIKKTVLVALVIVLAACTEEDGETNTILQTSQPTSDVSSASSSAQTPADSNTPVSETPSSEMEGEMPSSSQPATDNDLASQQDFLKGQELYGQYCAVCHLDDGSAPRGGELIGCTDCGDLSQLTYRIDETMPPTDTELLNEDESRQVGIYIQQVFNANVVADIEDEESNPNKTTMPVITPKEMAYKLAFDLAAKVPTAQDIENITDDADQVIDQWLNSEAYYQKLMSLYNRKLKTDSYHSRFERESNYRNARDLLGSCERGMGGTCNGNSSDRELYFPAYRWWDDLPFENVIADLTNDAIAREPLEYIRYVAKNDRPFSEILTADYTLVNAYSAKSINALNLDGSAIQSSDF